ncbi:MAG TPA: 1-acyl-sn-glycerol-3-phosphate acyltransferase, partial [Rariglobus sp.]
MISLLRFIVRILFRFSAINTGVLKTPGPVLLIPNHPSWLDWLFLGVCLDEDWRFVTSSRTAETVWFLRKVMVNRRTFPVVPTSPYAVREMADFLEKGGRLVLFAEGRISVTGSLMKLFEGTGFLIRKTGAKVITCHLHGAKRVRFVRHSGWTRWFPRVTAVFGPVLSAPVFPGLSPSEDRARLT